MPRCPIADVETYQTPVFDDDRGRFQSILAERIHSDISDVKEWKEVNLSSSKKGILRGLHMQAPKVQAKLLTVLDGSIWDVIVDLRPESSTYGFWCYYMLSADGPRNQIFIPAGCAHGFCTPDADATVVYLTDQPWAPDCEITLAWDDPEMGIPWPIENPTLNARDTEGISLETLKKALEAN